MMVEGAEELSYFFRSSTYFCHVWLDRNWDIDGWDVLVWVVDRLLALTHEELIESSSLFDSGCERHSVVAEVRDVYCRLRPKAGHQAVEVRLVEGRVAGYAVVIWLLCSAVHKCGFSVT